MRWLKHYRQDNDPRWRCCGCCHVQTGTICLGAYNFVLQLMAMCILMFTITHPEYLIDSPSMATNEQIALNFNFKNAKNENLAVETVGKFSAIPQLPTPLPRRHFSNENNGDESANIQKTFYSKHEMLFFTQKRIQSGDAHLALALVLGLFSITAMLIYGAAKTRPVYLLPFFCFQVFDFVLACLTALGHYTWLPNLREVIENNPEFPFRDQLLQMNAQWIALFISLLYVVVLMVKAYFIGVVWACYQYLHAKNTGVFMYRDDGDGIQRDAELLLPPDYENATKLPPVYQGPPPPYYHA